MTRECNRYFISPTTTDPVSGRQPWFRLGVVGAVPTVLIQRENPGFQAERESIHR